jgi:hypothetical protein
MSEKEITVEEALTEFELLLDLYKMRMEHTLYKDYEKLNLKKEYDREMSKIESMRVFTQVLLHSCDDLQKVIDSAPEWEPPHTWEPHYTL